jgi:chemotaxis protein methyltransferase CheR
MTGPESSMIEIQKRGQDTGGDEQFFIMLKNWIYENLHFDSAQYNDSYLRRRIKSRMFYHRISSFKDYFDYVKHNDREREGLLKNLTINVTRFYRNNPLWTELKNEVLPELLRRKGEGTPIRIWSAGCSSGEEPYTLVIILKEILGDSFDSYNFKIFATDIDSDALNKALMGEYTFTALTETNPNIIKKYFKKEGEIYIIDEGIKRCIQFLQHDIFHDKMFDNLDLILCRNVVIYFRREAKKKLYLEFYNHLNDQGYLILGKTEIILGDARTKFHTVNSGEKVYQRSS